MTDNELPSSHDVYMRLHCKLNNALPELCGIDVRKSFSIKYGWEYNVRVSKNNELVYLMTTVVVTNESIEYNNNIDVIETIYNSIMERIENQGCKS